MGQVTGSATVMKKKRSMAKLVMKKKKGKKRKMIFRYIW